MSAAREMVRATRRSAPAIRRDLARYRATQRRLAWAGNMDQELEATISNLREELWRDWRVMS